MSEPDHDPTKPRSMTCPRCQAVTTFTLGELYGSVRKAVRLGSRPRRWLVRCRACGKLVEVPPGATR